MYIYIYINIYIYTYIYICSYVCIYIFMSHPRLQVRSLKKAKDVYDQLLGLFERTEIELQSNAQVLNPQPCTLNPVP